jgi:PRTRC genetic system ThiF family protein
VNDTKYFLHGDMIKNRVKVAIAGASGSGGYMVEHLAKLDLILTELNAPGLEIHLYDGGEVRKPNIGRTRFSPVDVGLNKADITVARFNQFYGMDMVAHPYNLEVDSVAKMGFDLIIGCTDSVQFRVDLGNFSQDYRHEYSDSDVLYLDLGNEKYLGQYVLGHLFKDKSREGVFLPNVYDLYGEALEEALEKQDESKSCSLQTALEIQAMSINATVSAHALGLLYQLFKEGSISTHGGEIDLETHTVKALPINEDVWRFLGAKLDGFENSDKLSA